MDDLVAWLRAQLDDDERVARGDAVSATSPSPWRREYYAAFMHAVADANGRELFGEGHLAETQDVQHIVRWDPARVLAEVDAKRRILDLHDQTTEPLSGLPACRRCLEAPGEPPGWPCLTVRLLAQPYAWRDGWREEWRP